MEKFEQLLVWQKTHALSLCVYRLTRKFPDSEKYGLVSQMRRAAVSIAANIAEGSKGRTSLDRKRYHIMADGSLEELKYYLILVKDLGYIDDPEFKSALDETREIGKMLSGLTKSLACGLRLAAYG